MMKEMNLDRLISASPFTKDLSHDEKEGIFDYFIESDCDLNEVNIDDFVVNGTTRIDRKEYNAMPAGAKEDMYILDDNESNDYLFVMNY